MPSVDPQIYGAILAGGEGRRMGGVDKALLPFRDATLGEAVAARIAPQVTRLALCANGDPRRFHSFPGLAELPVLPDRPPSRGPLSGLMAALDWAGAAGARWLLTVPVDTPFLPTTLAQDLMKAATATAPSLARAGGRLHPITALWPVTTTRPALAAFLLGGEAPKVMAFATGLGSAVVDFQQDEAFENLNTPQDLARAGGRGQG